MESANIECKSLIAEAIFKLPALLPPEEAIEFDNFAKTFWESCPYNDIAVAKLMFQLMEEFGTKLDCTKQWVSKCLASMDPNNYTHYHRSALEIICKRNDLEALKILVKGNINLGKIKNHSSNFQIKFF